MLKKNQILLSGIVVIAAIVLRFSLPASWLSAATISAPEQGISVSAMVCRDILDSSPEITSIDADCSSLDWTALHHVSGYPACVFPGGEYFTQISKNDTFTDLLDTSGWITALTYDVSPAIPAETKLYYRVMGRDPAIPASLSSWSSVLTCGNDPSGGGTGGGGLPDPPPDPDPTCEDTGTCDIYCGDGVTVAYDESCPYTPPDPDPTCEDTGTCDIYCGDGVTVAYDETCPYTPPDPDPTCEDTGTCDIDCGNGVTVAYDETCPETEDPTDPTDDPTGDGDVSAGGGDGSVADGHSSAPETKDSDKDGCSDDYEIANGTDPNVPFSMDSEISDCDWVEFYNDVDLVNEDLSVQGGDYQDYEFWVTGAVNFDVAHHVNFALIDSDNFRIDIETLDLDGQSVYSFENGIEVKDGKYQLIATTQGVDGETLIAQDYINIDGCLEIGLGLENFSGVWFDNNRPVKHKNDVLEVDGQIFAYGKTTPNHIVKAYWNSVLLTSVVMADETGFYVESREALEPGEIHTLILRSEDPENPELKTAPLVIKFRIREGISFKFLISLGLLLLALFYHVYKRRQRSVLKKKLDKLSNEKDSLFMELSKKIQALKKYIYISGAVVLVLGGLVLYLMFLNNILSNMKFYLNYDQPKSTWQKNTNVDMSSCEETASFRHASQYRGVAENLVSIMDLQCMHTKILSADEVNIRDLKDISAALEIETLAHFGVLKTDVLGNYNPLANLTKADIVKALVLARCERPIKQSGLAYYNDVDPNAWYQDYIVTATLDGFVQTAYSDEAVTDSFESSLNKGSFEGGDFQPDLLMTRAEALKMILRAFELDTEIETFANSFESETEYADVSSGDEVYRFLNFAESKGILRLHEDRLFKPEDLLTKAEMARWIYEVAGYQMGL